MTNAKPQDRPVRRGRENIENVRELLNRQQSLFANLRIQSIGNIDAEQGK